MMYYLVLAAVLVLILLVRYAGVGRDWWVVKRWLATVLLPKIQRAHGTVATSGV